MGTSDVARAAQQAAQASGLPVDVVTTLIEMEGPTQSAPNNPFDVTQTWADLAGFGSAVSGIFNSVGVAIFGAGQEDAAIKAWAEGLKTFSNYANLRALQARSGTTVQDWFNALGETGYAGNDPGYGANLGQLYQNLFHKNPATTTLGGVTDVLPIQIPTPIKKPTQTTTTTGVQATVTATAQPTGNPITDITTAVAAIPTAITTAIISVEKFFWIFVGLILVLAGILILIQSSKQVQENERTAAITALAA